MYVLDTLHNQMSSAASLVPSPMPSFSALAVPYSKLRKAGRGTGNEAILLLYSFLAMPQTS